MTQVLSLAGPNDCPGLQEGPGLQRTPFVTEAPSGAPSGCPLWMSPLEHTQSTQQRKLKFAATSWGDVGRLSSVTGCPDTLPWKVNKHKWCAPTPSSAACAAVPGADGRLTFRDELQRAAKYSESGLPGLGAIVQEFMAQSIATSATGHLGSPQGGHVSSGPSHSPGEGSPTVRG